MDLYFKKKEQLNGSPMRPVVPDVKNELEKKRSASPVVASNVRSLGALPSQKVAYQAHVSELKNELQILSANLSSSVSDLKEQINKMQKNFESVKYETLKNHLNESISQQNENIKNITSELVSHLDKINSLESSIKSIEDIL